MKKYVKKPINVQKKVGPAVQLFYDFFLKIWNIKISF